MRTLLGLVLALCLAALSGCATTPYSKEVHAKSVAALEKQVASAQKQIDDKKKPVSLLYAGFALSKESQAFQGDVTTLQGLVTRIDKTNARLTFVNRQEIEKATLPFATEDDFELGIAALAKLAARAETKNSAKPLLVVLLTSHGGPQQITFNANGFNRNMHASKLAKQLAPLTPYPTLLIVSACHSGSLIPYLETDKRIIMTAAAADRVSFGCATNSPRTWYVDALAKAFDPQKSLRDWHTETISLVEKMEEQAKTTASQPQQWIGRDMATLADRPLAQLSAPDAGGKPQDGQ